MAGGDNLLIPTLNDDPNEIKEMVKFMKQELGPDTPWHVSRFYPQYKEQALPPTDVEELRKARRIGLEEGLHYVYTVMCRGMLAKRPIVRAAPRF